MLVYKFLITATPVEKLVKINISLSKYKYKIQNKKLSEGKGNMNEYRKPTANFSANANE